MEQRKTQVENIKKFIKQSSKGYKLIIIGILLSYFLGSLLQYFFTPGFRNTNILFDFQTLFMFLFAGYPILAVLILPVIGIRLNVVRIKQNQTNPRIGVGVTFFAIYFGMVAMFSLLLFTLGFVPGIIGIGPDLIILAGFIILLKAEKNIKKKTDFKKSSSSTGIIFEEMKKNLRNELIGYILIIIAILINTISEMILWVVVGLHFEIDIFFNILYMILLIICIKINLTRKKNQVFVPNVYLPVITFILVIIASGILTYVRIDSKPIPTGFYYYTYYSLMLSLFSIVFILIGGLNAIWGEFQIKRFYSNFNESSRRLRVDKFLRLVKISDTVKINDVLELLGITKDEWMIFQQEYKEILKGINIENDRISIDSEKDIEQFVFLLDQHFKSWEEKDKMKASKNED